METIKAHIVLLWPAMEIHEGECGDVARIRRTRLTKRGEYVERITHFRHETVVGVLVKADTDMADAFGEEPYTQSSRDNGCWSLRTCHLAPCMKAVLKGVTFDKVTGEPRS